MRIKEVRSDTGEYQRLYVTTVGVILSTKIKGGTIARYDSVATELKRQTNERTMYPA